MFYGNVTFQYIILVLNTDEADVFYLLITVSIMEIRRVSISNVLFVAS